MAIFRDREVPSPRKSYNDSRTMLSMGEMTHHIEKLREDLSVYSKRLTSEQIEYLQDLIGKAADMRRKLGSAFFSLN